MPPAPSPYVPERPSDPALLRRVALSSLLGTVIEYYDFLLYGTMAALVLGELFFPASDPAVGTIAAFGTLAAGYVARPLGGAVFGHFGDRLGRRSMLVLTMVLMGVASVLIGGGLTPLFARGLLSASGGHAERPPRGARRRLRARDGAGRPAHGRDPGQGPVGGGPGAAGRAAP